MANNTSTTLITVLVNIKVWVNKVLTNSQFPIPNAQFPIPINN
ncbi:hypothetical protein [Brunnivagina elsteri]|nr:hypothetical protein [Calothrix elsteri]